MELPTARKLYCTCFLAASDLEPKMPHKPDGLEAQCRDPFDSECPTDALSQKTVVDDRLGLPLCLRAKPPRDHLSAGEWVGTADWLPLRRGRGRRSCHEVSDLQSSGCHGDFLLRLPSAQRSGSQSKSTAKMPCNRQSFVSDASLSLWVNGVANDLKRS